MSQKTTKHGRKWCAEQGERIRQWKPWAKGGRRKAKPVMDDYQALAATLMGLGKSKA